MELSDTFYEYLHIVEQDENWMELPDNSPIMLRLRLLSCGNPFGMDANINQIKGVTKWVCF